MGERSRNREAVDRLARRIVEHGRATGKPVSEGDARRQAAEVGRMADRKTELDTRPAKPRGRVQPKWREVRMTASFDPRQLKDLRKKGEV